MDFSTAVRVCLQDYVTFSTRAPRSEYWWFQLFGVILVAIGVVIDALLLRMKLVEEIASLFILLPNISVTMRRLHDLDRTGWWTLLWFLPLVGAIVLIIWFIRPGTPGPNRFGPPRLVLP
jgi:uncharacterized membrane protein YhaH (DUF805 family)